MGIRVARERETNKATCEKVLFQVRYKPRLSFYDQLVPAALSMDDYPDWVTDRLRVILQNYDHHCNLEIGFNGFTYEQDKSDADCEEARIWDAINKLPKSLRLETFARLGYRRYYLIPVRMKFESLVNILYTKLFASEVSDFFPNDIDDVMYRVDSSESGVKYHIMVGPLKKEEVPQYLTLNENSNFRPQNRAREIFQIREGYPDVSVFVDIDAYRMSDNTTQEELTPDDLVEFAKKTRIHVDSMVEKLTSFLMKQDFGG